MLRTNQRPFYFTDTQVQQLKRTNDTVRKLNRIARGELRRIGQLGVTPRQHREAGESLGTIATRMTSVLQFRQGILTAGRQQQPLRIVVRVGMLCHHCSERGQLPVRDDDETTREALKQDPAHQSEITSLLELTSRIEELVSTRSTLRGAPLNAFFRQVSRFRRAVLKQQRDFQATALRQTTEIEIEVQDEDQIGLDICDECHKPMEIEGTTGDYERQV
jgi:hypothetical protein